MSDLLGILLGAALAVVSGLVTGIIISRYQARRTEEVARRIRRVEREEAALLKLEPKLPTTRDINDLRVALEHASERSIAERWSLIDDRLRDTDNVWRRELSLRVETPEIRAAVEKALGLRAWFARRLRVGHDEYGNEYPEGLEDRDRFARGYAPFADDLDRLRELIEARLRS